MERGLVFSWKVQGSGYNKREGSTAKKRALAKGDTKNPRHGRQVRHTACHQDSPISKGKVRNISLDKGLSRKRSAGQNTTRKEKPSFSVQCDYMEVECEPLPRKVRGGRSVLMKKRENGLHSKNRAAPVKGPRRSTLRSEKCGLGKKNPEKFGTDWKTTEL